MMSLPTLAQGISPELAESLRQQSARDAAARRQQTDAVKRFSANKEQIKKECGADFQTLVVGMPIDRVNKCVYPLRVMSSTVTPLGTMATYEGPPGVYITAQDNVVVSFTRM